MNEQTDTKGLWRIETPDGSEPDAEFMENFSNYHLELKESVRKLMDIAYFKESENDLTDEEKIAFAYSAGFPVYIKMNEDGRCSYTTCPMGIIKHEGRWIIGANDKVKELRLSVNE